MFVLEEWMKENGYQRVFLLDSDIMTFANYSEEVYPVLPNDCIAALISSGLIPRRSRRIIEK